MTGPEGPGEPLTINYNVTLNLSVISVDFLLAFYAELPSKGRVPKLKSAKVWTVTIPSRGVWG